MSHAGVLVHRCVEALGTVGDEAGKRRREDVGALEVADEQLPQRGGLWYSVDEDGGHGRTLSSVDEEGAHTGRLLVVAVAREDERVDAGVDEPRRAPCGSSAAARRAPPMRPCGLGRSRSTARRSTTRRRCLRPCPERVLPRLADRIGAVGVGPHLVPERVGDAAHDVLGRSPRLFIGLAAHDLEARAHLDGAPEVGGDLLRCGRRGRP